ncbi:hypothetical protein FsymDg_3274 [Candidatus Protofrankia datiscae]|uniref:Uncharacterized protein n=1 Tax=Candidatus Protofrankia datiscae TaxID=2716812 RepID=F8AZT9_9ACTN|nr:hypothetical protein FsymDg_3274 [Candidatus Protofrankia datiscae]
MTVHSDSVPRVGTRRVAKRHAGDMAPRPPALPTMSTLDAVS